MIKPTLDDIRKLAASELSNREFCGEFLETIANLVQADAGAVWDVGREPFQPIMQFARNEPSRLNFTREAHDKLLQEALTQSGPIVVRSPKADGPNENGPTLIIGRFHRFGPLVVELILNDADSLHQDPQVMRDFVSALKTATDSSPPDDAVRNQSNPINSNPINPILPKQIAREDISSYLTAIHSSIDKKLTCANVANETRRVLDCDRVSVLLKHRGQFRLFAISGQASVNRRSNTAKMLEQLAAKLLKTGQPFWYPDGSETPPQINSLLEDYLALTATRSLVVDPIHEKQEDRVEDPDSNERKTNRVIGGIVYEHCNEQWSRPEVSAVIEFGSEHGGNAIRNANRHQNLFLYPVWNWLGKSRVLTAPRILPKTLLAIAAILLVSAILVFWKVDFYVSADGVLVPTNLQPVFAQVDGNVSQLLIDHGSMVSEGETLMVLTSREHELRIKEIESNISAARQRLVAIEDRRFGRGDDESAVEDNINSLKSQIENYEEQLAILEKIASQMVVKSPIAGQVISWDLRRQLRDRPVQRGQRLLEIADVEGEWELELHLEDRRIGHLQRALEQHPDQRLPVTFLLAANASQRFQGELIEIAQATEITSDNEQAIKLRVKIDSTSVSIDQARTGISAKIVCGRTSLGYLWLHDIQEFFQKNVLFYFA